MSTYHQSLSKRLLDIFFSLLVLPIALPVMLFSVFLVLLTSGRPVFFFQERIGYKGQPFRLVKVRSLKNTFASQPGALHNTNDITMVGVFLRKTRIDEIPQIWNILKGEMSWVGPRPEVPFYFNHFRELDPKYAERQNAKPGITGLAQLDNPNASPNENLEKLTFDLQYVEKASLGLDLRILIQSFLFVWK
jgi:lipopolysaccharide/colanic/teichoic acid biosynthesis glycosyltransferase